MGEPTECRMYLCIRAENRNENGNFSLDTIFIGILMYNNENHLEK